MKNLIISTALLILTLIIVVSISYYLNMKSKEIIKIVSNIPNISDPNCFIAIKSLEKEWNKFKLIGQTTLNYFEIAKIDSLIEEMKCHYSTQNKNDFEYTKTAISISVKEIVRLEKISLSGIV